ncbi:two-component system regulatory protein YycI [Bacillus andreraoultii]|uniref:two-component system regulatory protein YycI n=1 Tax=Bacillus andreraoultii TaxID=1499685 RepID=UPI00053AE67E|nr:two-component system regulatory protein YycI [Bacillus andreraoultii]
MDWSRAKTVFIITFLIMDIFLAYQIFNQRSKNTYDLIQDTPIDQQLKADNIKIETELPLKPTKESYVEADAMRFSDGELAILPDQTIDVLNDTMVKSQLIKPYPLKKDWKKADVDNFVANYVYKGSQYGFYQYNKENHTIMYYQLYDGKMLYKNTSGQIEITLNDKNEIISYTQTMLDGIKKISEQDIITSHEAMTILYNKGSIDSGSSITNVVLGYYTLVPIKSSQLLAPTWCFTIDNKRDYFVNAVEGHVLNEEEEIVK